jgi:hypothetical protein
MKQPNPRDYLPRKPQKAPLMIRIDPKLKELFDKRAIQEGVSTTKLTEAAMRAYLKMFK